MPGRRFRRLWTGTASVDNPTRAAWARYVYKAKRGLVVAGKKSGPPDYPAQSALAERWVRLQSWLGHPGLLSTSEAMRRRVTTMEWEAASAWTEAGLGQAGGADWNGQIGAPGSVKSGRGRVLHAGSG